MTRVAAFLFALAFASPAFAVDAPSISQFCAPGQVPAVIRISAIKPTGSRAGFEEAARDHMKWYRDHGFTQNNQVVLNAIDIDPATHLPVVSKTKVVTIHYNPPRAAEVKTDAAWDAYVAKYRANSDILTEQLACVPALK